MTPPPKLTLSQWTEANARLPSTSAKPGAIRLSFTEYQRDILDAISDPLVERVVWMASSQLGKTTVELCGLGYFVDQDPASILFVQPTDGGAKDFSKERIAPFFESTPRLRQKLGRKTRDSSATLTHKEFPGGNLTLAGANAPAGLASRPKRVIFLDEVDRYPASAGTEGDPVTLAVKRSVTFHNRKIVMVSSPGIAGASRIEAAFLEGDQRRFFVPCPHCDHRQTLEWSQVHWSKDAGGGHLPATAAYHCVECGAAWTEAERHNAVRLGIWIASAPFNGTASFQLSELYSPFVTLAKIAREFLESKDNAERLKAWTNTSLGETFQERGDAPDWELVFARRDPTRMRGTVPAWAGPLSCGIDVQGDRVEAYVWAWGRDRWSALVDWGVFEGKAAEADVWQKLDDFLGRQWEGEDGRSHVLFTSAIDSRHARSEVIEYARRNIGKVTCIYGVSAYDRHQPVGGAIRVDLGRGRGSVARHPVSVSYFKEEFYNLLRLKTPEAGADFPPGWVFLPQNIDDETVKQLVSEDLVTVQLRNGGTKRMWRKTRHRNEALDCRAYARAAVWLRGHDQWNERSWSKLAPRSITSGTEEPLEPTSAATLPAPVLAPRRTPRPTRPSRGGGGWASRF